MTTTKPQRVAIERKTTPQDSRARQNAVPRQPFALADLPAVCRLRLGGGSTRRLISLLFTALFLLNCSGCGAAKDDSTNVEIEPPNGDSVDTPGAVGVDQTAPDELARTADPLIELANRLRTQREALEAQRVKREELVVKRRGELARLTSGLQRQIRRAGQTVDAVLAAFSQAVPGQGPLAAIHADYLRAGQLENHIARLSKALEADAALHRNLLRTEEKLRQDSEANAALDPRQREAAEKLLAEASQHDPFAAAPDGSLKPESVELQASLNVVAGALKTRVAAMPARPETSIDDLPALPELKFKTSGNVEATVLTAMQNDLVAGRTAAAKLFTDKQAEAAIERLHDSLDAVRQRLASLKTPPGWATDCRKLLDDSAAELSERLASPYLAALDAATKEAYLATEEAARTAKWAHVMDLLEALVQLAAQAQKIPDQFREIDEYLYSQERLESLEAAVARERFEGIRQMLNLGTRRVDTVRVQRPEESQHGHAASVPRAPASVHGVDLAPRQTAQNALVAAGRRYLELDAKLRQLLLRFTPEADTVKATERDRSGALDDVRRLLAARDGEDSRVFLGLEQKIAERRAARTHYTGVLGLRDDAPEVKLVDAQITAIQRDQSAFKAGHDRVSGGGQDVDLLSFVGDPWNFVFSEINSVGMLMVHIPKGSFTMGSPPSEDGRSEDESQVPVTITRDFALSAHEVTVGQVLEWLNDPATNFDGSWIDLDNEYCPVSRSRNRFMLRRGSCQFGQSEDQPMVEISWLGAKAFCDWLSKREQTLLPLPAGGIYRLPTEAEWEYACRAGTTTAYYWGNNAGEISDFAWFDDTSQGMTHPVGRKLPNNWGLFDMSGNVWEWTSDGYEDKVRGGSDPHVNDGSDRVYRGGCWWDSALYCRSAPRDGSAPVGRHDDLGFRVARAP